MTPEDWAVLNMRPPSANHDPFHGYVTIDGQYTDKGMAMQKFADAIRERAIAIRIKNRNSS